MYLLRHLIWVIAISASLVVPALAAPLGTEFTYQGQLIQNGNPVNGTATLRFSLWNALGGGTQVGGNQILSVSVTNGVFTALLNGAGQFGATAFNGDARWIQVDVCNDPGCITFTTLTPRQPVTAAPYAHFSAAPWKTSGGNLSVQSGNVGIGTSQPQAKLHVQGGDILAGLAGSEWMFHTRSSFNGDFLHITDLDGGVPQFQHGLVVAETGNVGIGITAPAAKLHVSGDIKLGPTGQHYATGGEENLRIMRGVVNINAGAPEGCCFSVARPLTGTYDITFTTSFGGVPVVTANATQTLVAVIIAPTNNSVRVLFYDVDGDPVNTGFHFIAIGPR